MLLFTSRLVFEVTRLEKRWSIWWFVHNVLELNIYSPLIFLNLECSFSLYQFSRKLSVCGISSEDCSFKSKARFFFFILLYVFIKMKNCFHNWFFVLLIENKNACLKKKADKIFSTFKCVSVSIYRWYTVNSNLSIQISSSAFNCELLHSTVNLSVPSWEIFSRLAVIAAFVIYRTSSNVTLSTITTSTFDYSCMLFVFKFCISTPFISLIMNSGPRR